MGASESLGVKHECGADEWYVDEKNGKKQCAPCHREYMARWRAENPNYMKEYSKKYREENREKLIEKSKKWRLKTKYDLTWDDFNDRVDSQGGVCAICGSPPEVYDRLCVDHDHDSGEVRGLLCSHCNQGLGSFRDDVSRLRTDIEYLEGSDAD